MEKKSYGDKEVWTVAQEDTWDDVLGKMLSIPTEVSAVLLDISSKPLTSSQLTSFFTIVQSIKFLGDARVRLAGPTDDTAHILERMGMIREDTVFESVRMAFVMGW